MCQQRIHAQAANAYTAERKEIKQKEIKDAQKGNMILTSNSHLSCQKVQRIVKVPKLWIY